MLKARRFLTTQKRGGMSYDYLRRLLVDMETRKKELVIEYGQKGAADYYDFNGYIILDEEFCRLSHAADKCAVALIEAEKKQPRPVRISWMAELGITHYGISSTRIFEV